LRFEAGICERNCDGGGVQIATAGISGDGMGAEDIRKTEWGGVSAVKSGCRQMSIDWAACI